MFTLSSAPVVSRTRWGANLWPPTRLLSFAALSGALALAGCGVGNQVAIPGDEVVLSPIQGHVHGGAFPIQNATVRLWETGNTTALGTTPTDQYGNFTFTTVSNCSSASDLIYATVNGGGTQGSGAQNKYLVQAGVIGSCSNLTSNAIVKLWLSELSTVAVAYTLHSFITMDASNDVYISAASTNSGTSPACSAGSCTAAGLNHAFLLASQLVDSVRLDGTQPTGAAQTTVSNNTNTALPNAMVNTIGDILQQCVDSTGTTTSNGNTVPTSQCNSLITNTTVGTTAPTSTLGAAMNMAAYPVQNVSNLLALIAPQTPFTPYLCSTTANNCTAPTSFAMPVIFGVNLSNCINGTCASQLPYPTDISVDINDDVYVLYGDSQSNSPYMAVGCVDSSAVNFTPGTNWTPTGASYAYPAQLTLDLSGHVVVTNNDASTSNGGLLYANATCDSAMALQSLATLEGAYGIAADRNNNFWATTSNTAGQIVGYYPTSQTSIAVGYTSKNFAFPLYGVALDSSFNVFAQGTTSSTGYVAQVYNNSNSTGTSTPFSGGYGGNSIAISSASLAYVPIGGYLNTAKTNNASTAPTVAQLSSSTGSSTPGRSQMDKTSTLFWVDSASGGYIYKYNTASTTPTARAIDPCLSYSYNSTVYTCLSDGYLTYRSAAIDSMGNVWVAVASPYFTANTWEGAVVELVGMGAPSWPLAYGYPGTGP